MNAQEPLPKVAVVVAHGVADQRANESARQVADLLLQVDRERPDAWWNGTHVDEAPYSPFREAPVHLRTLPLVGFESRPEQLCDTFYARSQDVRRRKARRANDARQSDAAPGDAAGPAAARANPAAADVAPTDIEFAEQVLAGQQSQGNDETYQTVCLTSRRLQNGQPTADVHLYEMYWADLSRVGKGAVQILGELYQILFHVPTLGRHVVNAAAIEHAQSRRWGVYAAVHRLAVGAITFPIAVFNILLVGMAVVILLCGSAMKLPNAATGTWAPRVATIVIWGLWSVVSVGLLGAIMLRRTPPRIAWFLAPLVVGMVLLLVGGAIDRAGHGDRANPRAAAVLALLAGALVAGAMIRAYAKRRPGTGRFGLYAGAILTGLFLVLLIWPGAGSIDNSIGVARGMLIFDVLLKALRLTWMAMVLLLIATWLAGRLAVAETKRAWKDAPPHEKPQRHAAWRRANQAEWTARLTLSLPSALFILAVLVMWAGVYAVVGKAVQDVQFTPALASEPVTVKQHVDSYLTGEVALMFALLAASVTIATVLMAWSVGPVAFAEIKPPRNPDDHALSLGQGKWLDHGFWLLGIAGRVVFFTIVLAHPLLLLLMLLEKPPPQLASGLLRASGAILGASAVGLFAFRGRLDKLSLGFRPLVDVMLDVDNHLRESPQGRNPRSLITARYASLLRHLCQWRDDGGRGYDAIVIIAHSQGTVVTADLFRLLRYHRHGIRHSDPELAPLLDPKDPLPVDLFTMGCPLGQLYARRFPHLYQWGYDHGGGSSGPPPADDRKPDPKVLGFRRWINTFRAGDYVGRSLWSPDDCVYDPTSPKDIDLSTPTPKRAEFCLGAGAHTHYWDSTAPQVAWMLDAMIARACRSPSPAAPPVAPVRDPV